MNRFLRSELTRYRYHGRYLALTAGGMLLAAYYLFSVVGRADSGSGDLAMDQYSTVTALALTVALCAVTVHGAALYARMIIADYSGNRRVLLYAYPGGRVPLFLAKNLAFAAATTVAALVGFVSATVIYLLMEAIVPVVHDPIGDPWVLDFLVTALNVSVLSVALSVVAGLIGLRLRSQIVALVAALVLIAVLANGATAVLVGSTLLGPVLTVAMVVIGCVLLGASVRRVERDEVL